jgi:hypothetical protein
MPKSPLPADPAKTGSHAQPLRTIEFQFSSGSQPLIKLNQPSDIWQGFWFSRRRRAPARRLTGAKALLLRKSRKAMDLWSPPVTTPMLQ